METKYKLSIPEPCHENWDKMTPKDNGRFCLSCAKTVVDFSKMQPEEIQHYFISNQGKSICGRFKKSQIDNIIIQIPSRVLYSQTNYHKMFLLVLFIVMGTTLFSCTDKNGNKQKIDTVEVVDKTSTEENLKIGKALKNDTINPPPPSKIDRVKFKKPIVRKEDLKPMNENEIPKIIQEEDTPIYSGMIAFETLPEYPGGIQNLKKWIQSKYVFSKNSGAQNDTIKASFVIERDGSLSTIKVLQSTENESEEKLTQILQTAQKWKPGTQNGKTIRTLSFITLFVKTDTVKKSFFRTKLISKIDSIAIKS
ncbi:energy transducer TonB [Flavobacterium poyangense]|uniref:energy transducer TonB n=1 Tax=Flavobacterium poyangense TaxID=2204302 RepID=UPI00142184B0|nr:hypothetical protein [Flavobacterium sp. JXAS1]